MTQSSGNDAISVAMYVVTPSIRLDGTNASNSQRSRRSQPGDGAASGFFASKTVSPKRTAGADRQTNIAQPAVRAKSARKPAAQVQLWVATRNCGSSRTG